MLDKSAYHTRWDQLELKQRKQNNLPEIGVHERSVLHEMLKKTFRDFLIAAYCDHWRAEYHPAAFALDSDRELLIARTTIKHHWTPGIAASLSTQDLALSLIDELATFKLPEMAVHVSYMNLQDLPKADYQALIQPHE